MGYMANAIFGHLRVHMNLQSRSGHDPTLPALIEFPEGQRAIDLATADHPFFLNMPIWRPPGVMLGAHAGEEIAENPIARQKWLDHIGAVTVFLYHLTFYLIGYAESYTDYSQHNWPSAPYPLPVPASGTQSAL
jgi:hypothetical protein